MGFSDFRHMDLRGTSIWTPPATLAPGQIPASAHFQYHYAMDREEFDVVSSEITTPSSHIVAHGGLSMIDSSLDAMATPTTFPSGMISSIVCAEVTCHRRRLAATSTGREP